MCTSCKMIGFQSAYPQWCTAICLGYANYLFTCTLHRCGILPPLETYYYLHVHIYTTVTLFWRHIYILLKLLLFWRHIYLLQFVLKTYLCISVTPLWRRTYSPSLLLLHWWYFCCRKRFGFYSRPWTSWTRRSATCSPETPPPSPPLPPPLPAVAVAII